MSEYAERYRTVASGFTQRATAVPDVAWEHPAPCEGWLARDIVRHLIEWIPPLLRDGAGIELPTGPNVDVDPAGAWVALSDVIQGLLDDPDVAAREFDHVRAGRHRLDEAIAMFFLGDVLIHTWDLARATGLDESLDPDEVERMLEGSLPMDAVLRQSGHYGPRVEVPDDADPQTRLIAFVGRRP